MMDFESGELDHETVVEGFQHLINSGVVWTLQGHYTRTAERLIAAGRCTRPVGQHAPPADASEVGPYVKVSRDGFRPMGAQTFRLVLYGGYNAMGLIGYEENGILVLSENRQDVVCDSLGREESGFHGPSAKQLRLYDLLITGSDEEFRAIVNAAQRLRYRI